ncbi:MAG: aminoacyl-tRNA hydrolase [Bacilli bacterium]
MKLIVGLGNPGKNYDKTRHNIGFTIIDLLAKQLDISITSKKFDSLYYQGNYQGQKYLILKPQTYMNNSGQAVIQAINYYKIALEDILVVYDDMDTKVGLFKIRQQGGSGGQNGMKNIIAHLKTQAFPRIKVGIGKAKSSQTIDYVLGSFSKEDQSNIDEVSNQVMQACLAFINNDINYVMNNFNPRKDKI